MPSVLFVCTANRFRSPFAEALFKRLLDRESFGQNWSVESAGTWAEPGHAVIPSVKWARDYFGLDLSLHKSRPISGDLLADYELILVMDNSHREALSIEFPETKGRLFLLAEVAAGLSYDIPDPGSQAGNDILHDIAADLSDLIDKGFGNICRLARQLHVDSAV